MTVRDDVVRIIVERFIARRWTHLRITNVSLKREASHDATLPEPANETASQLRLRRTTRRSR